MDDGAIARSLGRSLREHGLYGVLIGVADARVRLTGEVASDEEEDRALERATGTPGVASVEAELVVAKNRLP